MVKIRRTASTWSVRVSKGPFELRYRQDSLEGQSFDLERLGALCPTRLYQKMQV